MLEEFMIQGGRPLKGSVSISGAKNSAIKLLSAILLTDQPVILKNVPHVSDVQIMYQLLKTLGADIREKDGEVCVTISHIHNHLAHYDIVRKMRASIGVLGPLLARCQKAVVSLPGGCSIGLRPIDIHLDGLTKMGADITLKDGYVHAEGKLKGAIIHFKFPSMGATENIMMAATLAKGTTVIHNAACEPEIVDLANFLIKMGAKIHGQGTSTIEIQGVETLSGTDYIVMSDRLEAATYALAAFLTNGQILLKNTDVHLLEQVQQCFKEMNVVSTQEGVMVSGNIDYQNPVHITTAPYPGLATDLQPQIMTVLTQISGMSVISEQLFENRFMHVPELNRMGAKIEVKGQSAYVYGKTELSGTHVMASDLRGGAALVLAGLKAQKETVVKRVYHLDRGYARFVENLKACGAYIDRMPQQDVVNVG